MYLGLTKIPPVSDSTRNNKSPKGDWTFLCWFILLLIDFWFKIKPYATQMQFLCGCCDTRGCKSLKIQFIYFHWLHYKFFAQWSDHHWSLSSVVASHLFQVWLMFFYFYFFEERPLLCCHKGWVSCTFCQRFAFLMFTSHWELLLVQ